MHLFSWRSDALKAYGRGYIIVMAPDVDIARAHAMLQAAEELDSGSDGMFIRYKDENGKFYSEDDEDEYKKTIDKFARDLAEEPEILEHGVILIHGSE